MRNDKGILRFEQPAKEYTITKLGSFQQPRSKNVQKFTMFEEYLLSRKNRMALDINSNTTGRHDLF